MDSPECPACGRLICSFPMESRGIFDSQARIAELEAQLAEAKTELEKERYRSRRADAIKKEDK